VNYPDPRFDNFHPYLSPDPWADFYDDIGQRWSSVTGVVIIIHIFLFFVLSSNFTVPTLKPEEPEPIPVQIVTFGPAEAEPEPVIEPVPLPPAAAPTPPPPKAPRVKPAPPPPPPAPEPEPLPETVPEPIPEPAPEPEPIPEPEIVDTPPIFDQPITPEPLLEPEPLPEPVLEPLPEPILPDPIEPLPEPEPLEPIIAEPLPEPILEPDPILEPIPELEPLEPIETPVNVPTTAPEELPGVITETPEELLPEPELEPVIPTTPEPEIIQPETPPAPEPIEPEEITTEPEDEIIITTAPTILASPDAPSTEEEEDRAVPQSQAAPIIQPQGGARAPIGAGGGQPQTGGARPRTQSPSAGGTRRPPPGTGAGGWTLNTAGTGSPGAGYEGINLDIRCREAVRTHEDCPEYIRQQRGRDAQGFEGISAHRNTAIPTAPRPNTARNLAVGGVDTTSSASDANSFLDSAGLSSRAKSLTGEEARPNRVRDIFNPQPSTPNWQINAPGQTLPSTAPTGTPPPANNNWIIRQPEPETDEDEEEVIKLPPQP